MKEDIDKVSKTEQSLRTKDENAMVVDIGYENFALGIIHRGSTRNPPPADCRRPQCRQLPIANRAGA